MDPGRHLYDRSEVSYRAYLSSTRAHSTILMDGLGQHSRGKRETWIAQAPLPLAPGDLILDEGRVITGFEDANLLLWAPGAWQDVHVENGQEDPRGGWYSPEYSRIEPAPCVSLSLTTALPFVSATLLLPFQGTESPEVSFAFDGQMATVQIDGQDRQVCFEGPR